MKLREPLVGVGLTVAALLLAACGGGNADPLGEPPRPPSGSGSRRRGAPIVVGSADFTESKILAELYAQALMAKGVQASTKLGIGSREIYIKALQDQSISVVPEYTGNLLLNFDKTRPPRPPREVEEALPDALPGDLKVLKTSPAADQDVYVVTKDVLRPRTASPRWPT